MPQNTNDGTMALETDLTGIRVILIGRILFFFRLFSASLWIPSSPIYFTSTSLLHWFHLAGLQVLCEWSHILASLLNNAHQGIHFISNSLLWTIFAEVLLNRLLPQSNVVPLKNILLHTYHVNNQDSEGPVKRSQQKEKWKEPWAHTGEDLQQQTASFRLCHSSACRWQGNTWKYTNVLHFHGCPMKACLTVFWPRLLLILEGVHEGVVSLNPASRCLQKDQSY